MFMMTTIITNSMTAQENVNRDNVDYDYDDDDDNDNNATAAAAGGCYDNATVFNMIVKRSCNYRANAAAAATANDEKHLLRTGQNIGQAP
jgi:hypothetical protein